MKPKEIITQSLLKDLFDYDTETGIFTWACYKGKVKPGDIAGTYAGRYYQIKIEYVLYQLHRLAWIYVYGDIPEGLTVDHKNGVGTDNRIENLRLATRAEQQQNRKTSVNNTSGYIGVIWCRKGKKWQAQIQYKGKVYYLGLYSTPEEAYKIRELKKIELHTFNPIQRIT